ncbi:MULTISPECIES: ABC transporter ATP-binding protein [Pseudofrankia]|uniref:ABC transporter ATP-binding protein n=1 Tax=Pseudofrankia TaxID=2994363 RepID=UPI000234CA08|nr:MULTISPECIES: ATP-binding cassette domain-containing protein [Pseudofrankia]OHV34115.1 ABC transporter ATP-binding protein [Pseudofrankia sp. EUN1h]
MTAALAIEGLSAGYRGVPAVRDISIEVAQGRILALLGPNGAGKTTTLLAAAGVLAPLAGTVTALGAPVTGRVERTARAGVSLVPDNRGVFHRLTVAENLRLAGPRGDLDEILARFPQLRGLMNRRCGLLSGGEQQTLAIAKALLRKPRVLLVDELSMGLSPIAVQGILPVLRSLADEKKTAIVLVEQHIDQALSVADDAVVLHHGRIALKGPAAAMRADRARIQRAYFGR